MADTRLPAHITEDDVKLIAAIVVPAAMEAQRAEMVRLYADAELAAVLERVAEHRGRIQAKDGARAHWWQVIIGLRTMGSADRDKWIEGWFATAGASRAVFERHAIVAGLEEGIDRG